MPRIGLKMMFCGVGQNLKTFLLLGMEYRRLGKSGLQVSALSFGSWVTFGHQISDDTAKNLMHQAFDMGVNFFDNAEVYAHGKSEEVMGRILKQSGWSRDRFVVSSKVYWGGSHPNQTGLSRKHVTEACHAALKRLQVDYLDLYFCHRPDKNTPIEETVYTMDTLVRQGKILYWGSSEWEAADIVEAHAIARQHHLVPPTMEQPQYNMFHRERLEREYRNLYARFGMGTTIWSPLASGLLTGKYNQGAPGGTRTDLPDMQWLKDMLEGESAEAKIEKVKKLGELAKELQMSLPQLSIAWCLKNPNVSTVILGATKPEQLSENIGALPMVEKLSAEVMLSIESILNNNPGLPTFG
jgi:voltage-dependent potassium channel beta subunit